MTAGPFAVSGRDIRPDVKPELRLALLRSINPEALARMAPQQALDELSAALAGVARQARMPLQIGTETAIARDIYDDIVGLGRLEGLMARDDVNEIMVNGVSQCFIDTGSELRPHPSPFGDASELTALCQRIAARAGRRVDQASPLCDARLPDGSRVNIVFPPVAVDGPVLTIRKFPKKRPRLSDLQANGAVSERAASLLRLAVQARANIVITGGAGSGKTTLLNCLSEFAGRAERIVTCEDVAELCLLNGHVIPLEARTANSENAGRITMQDIVRNALRMRPDRIVVGEVRGAEAADLLHAMNTGHDGSMGTLHANSPADAIARLQALVSSGAAGVPLEVVSAMIAGAMDLVVHMARLPDGRRKVRNIAGMSGGFGTAIQLVDLIGPVRGRKSLPAEASRLMEKARDRGLWPEMRQVLRQPRQSARKGAARA